MPIPIPAAATQARLTAIFVDLIAEDRIHYKGTKVLLASSSSR
jgi:hypothetical protein